MTAQAMRAILLANATVTRRGGFLSRRAMTHSSSGVLFCLTTPNIEVAPMTSNCLRYLSPCFDILPSLSLPPDEFCRGTSPSHAASCRPDLN